MIFDTDILIWVTRGNEKAANLIEETSSRFISAQSYMELLQGAKNKSDQKNLKDFLKDFQFTTLPLNEKISHRASIYVEEYAISSGIRVGDAIIAATAIENNFPLCTGNFKHFKVIQGLIVKTFQTK